MNDETKYRIGYAAGRIEGVAVAALAIYGTYSIAKLGYEWVKLGIQTIKKHKVINI